MNATKHEREYNNLQQLIQAAGPQTISDGLAVRVADVVHHRYKDHHLVFHDLCGGIVAEGADERTTASCGDAVRVTAITKERDRLAGVVGRDRP